MADRRVWIALVALLAAAATGGSVLVAGQSPPPSVSSTVQAAEVVACPVLAGEATLWATAPGTTLSLRTADASTTVGVPVQRSAPTEEFSLAPTNGQPAGAVSATAGTAVSWGTCAPPLSSQTVLLADPRGTDLLLVNTDATDAVVNITLRGRDGLVEASGTRGLLVPALRSLAVPLSVLSPAGEPVAAEVETTIGRVRAFGRLAGSSGIDVAASGQVGTDHLLGAVPAGASRVTLLVANPGAQRATLTVSALAGSGRFTPAGAERVTIAPGTVGRVDLSAAASATEPIAVQVASDEPVTAALTVGGESDVAGLASQAPLLTGQVVVPGGRLVLANPSDADATVSLEADAVVGAGVPRADQVVRAGAVWSLALPARASVVRITSASPVGAWVVLPTGTAVAPLQSVQETVTALTLDRDPQLR